MKSLKGTNLIEKDTFIFDVQPTDPILTRPKECLPIAGPSLHFADHVPSLTTLQSAYPSFHLGDRDRSGTRARESLDSHDLEVEVLVGKAVLGPGIEVVRGGDRARGALVLPDRPVLGEGAGASNGRLVGASVGAQSVSGAIRRDGTELGHSRRTRVETTVVLDDVVLGLRVVDPAVDGKVRAAAARLVGSGVGDGSAKDQSKSESTHVQSFAYLADPVCHPRPATTSVLPIHLKE